MRASIKSWMVGLTLLGIPYSGLAAELPNQIHFKPGEIKFINFLEMVSEKLDIQIDASGLEPNVEHVVVPDAGALSSNRAKALVLSSLYLQGYTWIHDTSTDLYRVMRQRDARDQEIPIITDGAQLPDNDLIVTFVMVLEHASPDFIARSLRSLMSASARIIPDDTTNSVLLSDSAYNISKLRKLVQLMDTPQVAKQAKEWLAALSKKDEAPCSVTGSDIQTPQTGILIVLFSLLALVIGFLARGYVIRRIEGGL